MGVYAERTVNGQKVAYDSSYAHRWLNAWGPAVNKLIEEFVQTCFEAADTPAAWTVTLVETGAGETTLALVGGSSSGELLITTDAADNDGANMQAKGEAFLLSGNLPAYFGIRFKASEATQSDFLAGLCITNTNLLGGMTDGVYFRKVDASTGVSFVVEQDSAETETAGVLTFAANTYYVLEIVYDGSFIYAYVDGSLVATVAASNANVPNDEYLTPSVHFLTGEANAKTMTIDWIRAIQITAG